MADSDSITVQMYEILDEVSDRVKGVMKTSIKEVAKETAKKLRSVSPKGATGSYAKGWKAGARKDGDYVVHNATDYQLTHLLENGHVVRNKYGTYGRAPAQVHIKPVEEWANDEVVNRITEELNGNL